MIMNSILELSLHQRNPFSPPFLVHFGNKSGGFHLCKNNNRTDKKCKIIFSVGTLNFIYILQNIWDRFNINIKRKHYIENLFVFL